MSHSIEELQQKLREFSNERDWNQFHSLRNLLLALVGEIGELSEVLQWTGEISPEDLKANPEMYEHFKEELADVFIYLIRLADISSIDICESASEKIKKNAAKYPSSEVYGKSDKR